MTATDQMHTLFVVSLTMYILLPFLPLRHKLMDWLAKYRRR